MRTSRATLAASRAILRSTAAGLSAADLARAARSNRAFLASAAAAKRSPNPVLLDLFISIYDAQVNWLLFQRVDGFRSAVRHAIIQVLDEAKLEKLARRYARLGTSQNRRLPRRGGARHLDAHDAQPYQ